MTFDAIYKMGNGISIGFLGFGIGDVFSVFGELSEGVSFLVALSGLVWFIIAIPHKRKMQKLERMKLKREIEGMEIDNEKKSDNG